MSLNLVILLNKIWIYLGVFYLSLLLCLLIYNKKTYKIVLSTILMVSLIFSLKLFYEGLATFGKNFQQFVLFCNGKVTLNQKQILEKIKDIAPIDKIICYPWPSDISGRYAQQYLYPTQVVLETNDLQKCDYLVLDYTTGNRKYTLGEQILNKDIKLYGSDKGEIYQITK